jgi:hypothetical protein
LIHVDPNPQDADELEVLAAKLEATGTYRVLRKLASRLATEPPAGVKARQGLFVDTETTGLDQARDEIIELAMVPFTYGLDGQVYSVGEPFQRLREPSKPIPAEITAITGIDDAMVAGKCIDPGDVAHAAASASLVVAHNAAFDRRFLERFCNTFNTKPWACSMSEVDWAGEGYEGTKLAYLAPPAPGSSTNVIGRLTTAWQQSNYWRAPIQRVAGPALCSSSNVRGLPLSAFGRRTPLSILRTCLRPADTDGTGRGPAFRRPGIRTSPRLSRRWNSRSLKPKSIEAKSTSWFGG